MMDDNSIDELRELKKETKALERRVAELYKALVGKDSSKIAHNQYTESNPVENFNDRLDFVVELLKKFINGGFDDEILIHSYNFNHGMIADNIVNKTLLQRRTGNIAAFKRSEKGSTQALQEVIFHLEHKGHLRPVHSQESRANRWQVSTYDAGNGVLMIGKAPDDGFRNWNFESAKPERPTSVGNLGPTPQHYLMPNYVSPANEAPDTLFHDDGTVERTDLPGLGAFEPHKDTQGRIMYTGPYWHRQPIPPHIPPDEDELTSKKPTVKCSKWAKELCNRRGEPEQLNEADYDADDGQVWPIYVMRKFESLQLDTEDELAYANKWIEKMQSERPNREFVIVQHGKVNELTRIA